MTDSTASLHPTSELSAADIEIIENFVQGKKKIIVAAQLQVEYSEKAMKLLDRRGRLIAMSKQVNEWQQKVLLNNQVEGYMSLLCATLERHDFLAVRKSRHPEFVEYSKYQTPEGYSLRYQPAHIMGIAWLERYAQPSGVKSRSLLVFQDSNWFPIQELKIDQRTLRLRTLVGETIIDSNDYFVWIEQSSTTTSNNSAFITTPTMTIDPESPETNMPDPAQELIDAIKVKALKRLLDYVKNGEKVTITEVLKNGQDQTITTKTTEIQRSCPRWVIERVRGAAEF